MPGTYDEQSIRVYYRGNKYDVPVDFATRLHPGGKNILMRYKDCDITKDFEKTEHSIDAVVMLNKFAAGNVEYAIAQKALSPFDSETKGEEVEKAERENTKRWNRLAIAFGLASIVAAVHMRK